MEFTQSDALTNVQQLIMDCISHGAEIFDDIEFKYDESSGVGVVAAAPIAKGTKIFSIPLDACISVNTITSYEPLTHLFEEYPTLSNYPDEVLALGLMYGLVKDDENCPWRKHVLTLPKRFNTPLYWSEEDLTKNFAGHNIFHLTNMMKRQQSTDFDSIHGPITAANLQLFGRTVEGSEELVNAVDLDVYVWAMSIVYSRAIDITKQDETVRLIVPILDMLNHSPSVATSSHDTFQYNEAVDRIEYTCCADLENNDECYAIYGAYCNAKLLYTYGFVLLPSQSGHNSIQAMDIWTRLVPTSYAYEEKQRLLQKHSITSTQTYDFQGTIRRENGNTTISRALMTTIRIIQADESDMSQAMRAFHGQMITLRNERASYIALRNLIVARMKVETAEVERKRLGELLLNNTTASSDHELMALVIKVEERELLQSALELVDGWLRELEAKGGNFHPQDV